MQTEEKNEVGSAELIRDYIYDRTKPISKEIAVIFLQRYGMLGTKQLNRANLQRAVNWSITVERQDRKVAQTAMEIILMKEEGKQYRCVGVELDFGDCILFVDQHGKPRLIPYQSWLEGQTLENNHPSFAQILKLGMAFNIVRVVEHD